MFANAILLIASLAALASAAPAGEAKNQRSMHQLGVRSRVHHWLADHGWVKPTSVPAEPSEQPQLPNLKIFPSPGRAAPLHTLGRAAVGDPQPPACCSFDGGASCGEVNPYCDDVTSALGQPAQCENPSDPGSPTSGCGGTWCPEGGGKGSCAKDPTPRSDPALCPVVWPNTAALPTSTSVLAAAVLDENYKSTDGQLAVDSAGKLTIKAARANLLEKDGFAGGVLLTDGSKFIFKGVDMSQMPPGSVGTFYTTTLASSDAQDVAPQGFTWTDSSGATDVTEPSGSMFQYCDAQGCSDWAGEMWDSDKCKVTGQSTSDLQVKHRTACPEMDLFEANKYGFASTTHGCTWNPDDANKPTIVPGSCDADGSAIWAGSASKPKHTTLMYTGTKSCPATLGSSSTLYGPDPACPIDTTKPFDVTIAFNMGEVAVTLTQGDEELKASQTMNQSINTHPSTLLVSQWGSANRGTVWLDECTDACSIDGNMVMTVDSVEYSSNQELDQLEPAARPDSHPDGIVPLEPWLDGGDSLVLHVGRTGA